MPLHERKLVPEYYGAKDGMVVKETKGPGLSGRPHCKVYLAPSKKQIESGELLKRRLPILRSEVDILAPK